MRRNSRSTVGAERAAPPRIIVLKGTEPHAAVRHGVRMIPGFPPPLPDETMWSWLDRAGRHFGFDGLHGMIEELNRRAGPEARLPHDAIASGNLTALRRLLDQTGVEATVIDGMQSSASMRNVRYDEVTYCPQCLLDDFDRNQIHVRRRWLQSWSVLCDVHGCTLGSLRLASDAHFHPKVATLDTRVLSERFAASRRHAGGHRAVLYPLYLFVREPAASQAALFGPGRAGLCSTRSRWMPSDMRPWFDGRATAEMQQLARWAELPTLFDDAAREAVNAARQTMHIPTEPCGAIGDRAESVYEQAARRTVWRRPRAECDVSARPGYVLSLAAERDLPPYPVAACPAQNAAPGSSPWARRGIGLVFYTIDPRSFRGSPTTARNRDGEAPTEMRGAA